MSTGRWPFWIVLIWLAGCGAPVEPEAPAQDREAAAGSATSRALEELSAAYDELAGLVDRDPGEAVDWAQGDIENLGDFEYRIVELDDRSVADRENALNALGDERWEAYWIEPADGGIRVYLKRSSISYLSRLPLSALLRLIGGSGGQ